MTCEQNKSPPAHTPGPWHIASQDDYDDIAMIVEFSGKAIANVRKQDGIGEANAALIAAAPDLLAAVILARSEISRHLEFLRRNNHTDRIPWLWAQESIANFDAVIAKAINTT